MPSLLELSRELAALSQAGLAYTKDPFDKQRFKRVQKIAGELLQNHKQPDFAWPQEVDHPTPKIDVRGIIFHEDQILLVQEHGSKQSAPPGGWTDVNFTLRENVE